MRSLLSCAVSVLVLGLVPLGSHATPNEACQGQSSIQKQLNNLNKIACNLSCTSPSNESAETFINQDKILPTGKAIPDVKIKWAKFGESVDEFNGVKAYANKEGGAGGPYQCTELVHRYLNERYQVPTKIGMGMGNADLLGKNLVKRYQGQKFKDPATGKKFEMIYLENKCSQSLPHEGSIISLSLSKFGHIGIVKSIRTLNADTVELHLFEQHGIMHLKPGAQTARTKVVLKKDASGRWSGDKVIGWVNFAERN